MKISEIIKSFEALPNFADDPDVNVRVLTLAGKVNFTATALGVLSAENGKCDVLIEHNCPKSETEHHYYWNGKLLDDMSADELKAAVVSLLAARQTLSVNLKSESSKPAAKNDAPVKA